MATLQLARSGAEAGLQEVSDNVAIIDAYKALFVARAARLYDRDNIEGDLKRALERTLNLSSTDMSPSYAGLFVQTHSIFERYVSLYVKGCAELINRTAQKYSDLPNTFRDNHTTHAAGALTHFLSGNVNGVTFDFTALMRDLAICFSDDKQPALTPRVFTISMGNCTPDRIDKLFKILGMNKAFDDAIGGHTAIKSLDGYKGKAGALSKQAKDAWSTSIVTRNRLVHDSDAVPQIASNDVLELVALARALIAVFHDKALATYP